MRGWKVVAVLLVVLAQRGGEGLVRDGAPSRGEAVASLGVLLIAALVGGGYAVLAWQRSRYRVDADVLQVRTGVLYRQERHARLDRLQAVDVVRPLLARFFGLAELRVEVAGGKNSVVSLSLVRDAEAEQLRATLLARAAGLVYVGEQAPRASEREVVAVPVGRTVESIARSGSTAVAVLALLGLVGAGVATGQPGLVAFVVPVVAGAVGALWTPFTRGFGFRVAVAPDGLRLRHGLLTARTQTVPPGRVQAVQLSQPLLWRTRDWWQLRVNVAGYSGSATSSDERGDSQQQENVLLPVATRGEALMVLSLVLPGSSGETSTSWMADWHAAVVAGMTGTGASGGWVPAPRRARWLDPLSWPRHGYLVTDDALLLRRGRMRRELQIVPHARTQSLGVVQGPWQRRLGLATFAVHSTTGPVRPQVRHLAVPDLARLLDEQSTRARTARIGAGDTHQGRWLTARSQRSADPGQRSVDPGST
ncbi:MAG: PH domain-containing protein [Angustibacter sp.]